MPCAYGKTDKMRLHDVLVVAAGLVVALGGCSFSTESKVEATVSTEVSDEGAGEQDTASSADELYDFAVGTVSDDTYTNEFLGISVVAPEGFAFVGQDDLAEQYNDGVAPEQGGDAAYVTLAANESYIDAVMLDDEGDMVDVCVSCLGSDFDLDPNSEEYLDAIYENAVDAIENVTVEWEQGTYELEDYTFPVFILSVDDGSGTVTHREIVCLVLNGYSVSVEAVSLDKARLDSMLSGITLLYQ